MAACVEIPFPSSIPYKRVDGVMERESFTAHIMHNSLKEIFIKAL